MVRPVLKVICILSGILTAGLGVYIAAAAVPLPGQSTGIIGGADWPTLLLLLQASPVWPAVVCALLVFAGTGVALLFSRK